MDRKKLDLTNSRYKLKGEEQEQREWQNTVNTWVMENSSYQAEKQRINSIRRDFFEGRHSGYTNINGQTVTSKKGHSDATYNMIKQMALRIQRSMSGNPPGLLSRPNLKNNILENARTQAVEDFVDKVLRFDNKMTKIYRRAVQNQVNYGEFAIMVYPDFAKDKIVIENVENVDNLIIGWTGDGVNYDYVIYEQDIATRTIERQYGVKVEGIKEQELNANVSSGHENPYEITTQGTKSLDLASETKPTTPTAKVTMCWTPERNITLIEGQIVQYEVHNWGFIPVFVGQNIPNTGRKRSMSDMDDWIEPQIELNQMKNDNRDFLRTAVNKKYTAKNMDDFDANSISTTSGQVIFLNDDEEFTALPDPVNTFPIDTAINDTRNMLHLLGVSEIAMGGGITSGVSGKAMAIGFDPYSELLIEKQNEWSGILMDICNAIQFFGNRYFKPKNGDNFFLTKYDDGEIFQPRMFEPQFDENIPTTKQDRQIGIINKINANVISLETALAEMGYDDPNLEIEKLKKQFSDPVLGPILTRQYNLTEGVREATEETQEEAQKTQAPSRPNPVLTTSQNQEGDMPMAMPGSGMSVSSPEGILNQLAQNQGA